MPQKPKKKKQESYCSAAAAESARKMEIAAIQYKKISTQTVILPHIKDTIFSQHFSVDFAKKRHGVWEYSILVDSPNQRPALDKYPKPRAVRWTANISPGN